MVVGLAINPLQELAADSASSLRATEFKREAEARRAVECVLAPGTHVIVRPDADAGSLSPAQLATYRGAPAVVVARGGAAAVVARVVSGRRERCGFDCPRRSSLFFGKRARCQAPVPCCRTTPWAVTETFGAAQIRAISRTDFADLEIEQTRRGRCCEAPYLALGVAGPGAVRPAGRAACVAWSLSKTITVPAGAHASCCGGEDDPARSCCCCCVEVEGGRPGHRPALCVAPPVCAFLCCAALYPPCYVLKATFPKLPVELGPSGALCCTADPPAATFDADLDRDSYWRKPYWVLDRARYYGE